MKKAIEAVESQLAGTCVGILQVGDSEYAAIVRCGVNEWRIVDVNNGAVHKQHRTSSQSVAERWFLSYVQARMLLWL